MKYYVYFYKNGYKSNATVLSSANRKYTRQNILPNR